MLQSIIVYGFLTIFMMIFSNISAKFQERNVKSLFQVEIFFLIMAFAIICGLRYDVGVDYFSYLGSYDDISKYNDSESVKFEIGFKSMMQLLAAFEAHFFWFFFVTSLVQIYFITKAFETEKRVLPYLSFVLMTGGIYFTLMNEIRQGIVVCIFLFATRFILERNLIKYLLCFLLSYTIHKSALIFIPIYFIFRIDRDFFKNTQIQLIALFMAVVLSSFNVWTYWLSYIEKIIVFAGYDNSYGSISERMALFEHEYSKGARYYFPVLINIIIILYSRKMKSYFEPKKFRLFYNIYFIGAITNFLFYNNTLMQRPVRFFTFFQLIMTSYLFLYLWKSKQRNKYNFLAFIFLVMLHLVIFYAFVASDHHTMYKFFWEK
ncbi:MAG: EpsG family protein [Tenacibaculum sp.]|nr:EpsG family protein [Tenacibaculum sp.]